jgi:sigma-B regulation protein RsbU (phosphoserine phosphatase)
MGDERAAIEALRKESDELSCRLREYEAFDSLRRELRGDDATESLGNCAALFVTRELRATACAILVDDASEGLWSLVSLVGVDSPNAGLPATLERPEALVDDLGRASSARGSDLAPDVLAPLTAAWPILANPDLVLAPLRDDQAEIFGIAVAQSLPVTANVRFERVAEELAFSLAAAAKTRAHTAEIAMLAVQERELVGLLREVEERDALIREDLDQARQFQNLMLGALPRVRGVRLDAMYEPLGVVGGDLYAVSDLGDRIRVFIADATGHGVRGCLTTMFIKNGYESVKHTAPDPACLLEALNDGIARTYRTAEMLFTAACLDVDLATGNLTIAYAAHPPACIVSADRVTLLEGDGAILGMKPRIKFELSTAHLGPGDGVYVYTDGIGDTHAESGALFGEERLLDTIRDSHRANASVADAVRNAMRAFAGKRGLKDDATLVGLRLIGDGSS